MGWQDAQVVGQKSAWEDAPVVGRDAYASDSRAGMEHTRSSNPNPMTVQQAAGDLGAGALKGASEIGSTIISPLDNMGVTGKTNEQRRAEVTQGLQDMGANPESFMFGLGKVGAEVAGTAGMGGALGQGLSKVGGAMSSIPSLARPGSYLAKLPEVLRTGGMSLGAAETASAPLNAALRVAGGTLTGGAMAGAINPEDAGTGALIGGAIPAAAIAAPYVGKAAANIIGGLGTHTGGESLKQAAIAGQKGGKTAQQFQQNMRGQVPMTDVLDDVTANISEMGRLRSQQYKVNMKAVGNSLKPLSYRGIDQAVDDALNAAVTKKGFIKNKAAASIQKEIADVVEEAKSRGMNTAEDFDSLKQRINAIRESIPMNERTAQKVAGDVFNSVKNEIIKQEPGYAKAMKDYTDASDLLGEIRRTLSNKPNASIDTQMRKLQSLMRNNVSTNYGNRLELVNKMEQQGGKEIMPALAGQALNTWTPRGLGSAVAGGLGLGGYAVGGAPLAIPMLAAQSPRLMGEAAYYAGKGSNALSNLVRNPAVRALPLAYSTNE